MRRGWHIVVVLVVVAAGCSGDDNEGGEPRSPTTTASAPSTRPMDEADVAVLRDQVASAPGCDPLDPTSCLLPFPSNRFTVADATMDSGRRVALPEGLIPNASGATLDVGEWNRNDGFSPGTPLLVHFEDLDPVSSRLPTQGDIAASLRDDSASVMVDVETGQRLAHWAELDSAAPDGSPRLLILHPAAAFAEGHRIAVGFGGLVTSSGTPIEASLAFRAYRDSLSSGIDAIETQRDEMERGFAALAAAGVTRDDLVMAWTFTVASGRNLSERLLTMRDDAFERLGDEAPAFSVDEVVSDPAELHDGIARIVRGTFDVPSYLEGAGEPGSAMHYDEERRLPTFAGYDYRASFTCQVPAAAADGSKRARMVVYGHGLLGSRREAENSQVGKIASTNTMLYCATDWIGMSRDDIGNAVKILGNLSSFSTLADRGQQGILNTLVLARLMSHRDGLASNAAFQGPDGSSILEGDEVYYDGNSQGAIMGGAATAVAQDWTKAVLGVPGMNYSVLLSRSVDFTAYFAVMTAAYPNRVDQQLVYGLLQMLWDRIETNGYAQHITDDPYRITPEHQVILDVAFGDHQVANVAAEMEARTIGADIRQPALEAGRHPDTKPYFGLKAPDSYPTARSLLIYWDSGTLASPEANTTPTATEGYRSVCGGLDKDALERKAECSDPREDPRRDPATIRQKDAFFRPDGRAIDPCDGAPCTAELRATLDY